MMTTEMRLRIKRLKGKGPQLQLQPRLSRASNLRFSMSPCSRSMNDYKKYEAVEGTDAVRHEAMNKTTC